MAGNPTGAMGVPDYLGWDWKSKAGIPIVCVPGLPDPAGQPVRDDPLPALPGDRPGADDPARRRAAAARGCSARPCTRAATAPATTSRATSPTEYGSPKCIVKLGCWGPVVKCNVPKRGWINGVGGCPNVGGICIGCTMPGFPDKFMPFMDEPPGAQGLDDGQSSCTARRSGGCASITDADRSTRSRSGAGRGDELLTGYEADLVGSGAWPRRTTADGSRQTPQGPRRDGVGPDHPHRRQPRHLHEDRLRQPEGRRVPQHVVDLPRLQHLHEGQGPARRALHHQPHLRDLRRQPRHLLLLRAEHGLRRAAAGPRRVDRQPRRGRRVHVRPQHLPGEPGRRRLLREDGRRDQPRRAGEGREHRGAARRRRTATARSATSCGRSTRSPASSTARRCRSAATRGRCSA